MAYYRLWIVGQSYRKGTDMKKVQISIKMASGNKSIPAFVSDKFPGLALHKALRFFEGGQSYLGNWTVTHVKTGYRACTTPWPLRRQAAAYAQTLCSAIDWTADDPREQFKGTLYQTATRAIEAAKAVA